MQLQGRTVSTEKTTGHGFHRAPVRFRPGWVGQLLPGPPLDLRPPRDASPPFLPATRASSLVNSCAVPFWCAARPPFAAIARCACGSIAANPRGVLRMLLVLRDSPTPSLRPLIPPLPLPTPLLLLRSSILSSWLLRSSAIIGLLPRISSSMKPLLDVQASGRNFGGREKHRQSRGLWISSLLARL
jgi:hypothetical protein